MNQILQVKNTQKRAKLVNPKKVVLFFIIIIAMLGLGVGGYYIYQNIINGNIEWPLIEDNLKSTSTITLTQIEKNKLVIKAQNELGISKMSYSLNSENVQDIELSGETIIEKTINMSSGENTIYISVIDINGKETKKQEKFVVELSKPIIDLSVIGNDIKITVNSEEKLEEITYKWNSENEKKENMKTYENRMTFEKQLEIPIGNNTLTIVAIDVNGERTEKIQEIKGITKPTTKVEVLGEYWHFTVNGKENIQKVEFVFNGQKYLMNADTFGETKTVHYKVKLVDGNNFLTVTSITQSGGIDTTSFEQKYTKK